MSKVEDPDSAWFRSDQRCGIDNCRSKRFRRAEDGLIYCSYGHQSDAPALVTFDDEDYRDPSQRITKAKAVYTPPTRTVAVFEGAEAVEQYLVCYQVVLVKQCQWLISTKGFPAEFEEVVKDLWALRLQMLDPLIRKAADENLEVQTYSSDLSPRSSRNDARRPTSLVYMLRLEDCLGILYFGAVLLQLPVMTRDVLDWIREEAFPYIRVEPHIPLHIYRRLPVASRRTFQTRTSQMDNGEMHRMVLDLAKEYLQSPNPIQWPSINSPPVLFRIISEAALPVEVFSATLKLGSCLNVKTSLSSLNMEHKRLADYPELQLIAVLVIVVKLLFPFDDLLRPPRSASEPAALALNWFDWAKVFEKHPIIGKNDQEQDQEEIDEPVDHWNVHEHDVLDMDGERIDDYLDWFQQTWISEEVDDQGREQDYQRDLDSLFPLPAIAERTRTRKSAEQEHSTVGRLKRVQAGLNYQPPARTSQDGSKSATERPGSRYKQYRTVDNIPSIARPFFELMGHLGAVSVEQLVSAVFRMEGRLRRWDEGEAKKSAIG